MVKEKYFQFLWCQKNGGVILSTDWTFVTFLGTQIWAKKNICFFKRFLRKRLKKTSNQLFWDNRYCSWEKGVFSKADAHFLSELREMDFSGTFFSFDCVFSLFVWQLDFCHKSVKLTERALFRCDYLIVNCAMLATPNNSQKKSHLKRREKSTHLLWAKNSFRTKKFFLEAWFPNILVISKSCNVLFVVYRIPEIPNVFWLLHPHRVHPRRRK